MNESELMVSAKYMANDNRYQYGKWNGAGNGTVYHPGDGWHYDCGTADTWVIRDAKNGHKHINTPFSSYIWPNNDGSPYFDAYLLNNGFTRYTFNPTKAKASGYHFIPVVGTSHCWAWYDVTQDLQFEANDGYGSGSASIDIHKTIYYSDSKYMYFPTAWEKANAVKEGLQNQADSDGRWAYYTNGKVDTSVTTVAQNIYGWWYVKNGYVDFDYYGLAPNEYGWWVIEAGKVNFDAKAGFYHNEHGYWWCEGGKVQFDKNALVCDGYDGSWKLVKGGKYIEGYTGIASNAAGLWYLKNGTVDFSANGTISIPCQVKNGMVMFDPKDLEA